MSKKNKSTLPAVIAKNDFSAISSKMQAIGIGHTELAELLVARKEKKLQEEVASGKQQVSELGTEAEKIMSEIDSRVSEAIKLPSGLAEMTAAFGQAVAAVGIVSKTKGHPFGGFEIRITATGFCDCKPDSAKRSLYRTCGGEEGMLQPSARYANKEELSYLGADVELVKTQFGQATGSTKSIGRIVKPLSDFPEIIELMKLKEEVLIKQKEVHAKLSKSVEKLGQIEAALRRAKACVTAVALSKSEEGKALLDSLASVDDNLDQLFN